MFSINKSRTLSSNRTNVAKSYHYFTLAVFIFIVAFPFWWMVVVATNDQSVLAKTPPPIGVGPNFFKTVDTVYEFVNFNRAIANSFFISIIVAAAQVFFCSFAGYAFSKLEFFGKKFLFLFILFTMMIPGQLGIIPLYMLIVKLQWVDSLKAVIVPGLVSAFGVFWMKQVISSVLPDEIIQAARVDGATPWQIFTKIVFPIIRPTALVMGLFAFLAAWNDFMWPMLVLSGKQLTVQTAIKTMRSAYYVNYSAQMGASLLATVPLLIIFFIVSKQLVKGVMDGAVKG
jgi:cellobiose transport system permease protein